MGKAMHLALRRVLVLFSLLMGGLVCLWPGVGNSAEPLSVFVSILPQKYFVDKIGGDLVHVSVMVPPGANPHLYEPRPGQMAALAKTRIYFAVGVTFEVAWLPRLAPINPSMKIVTHGGRDSKNSHGKPSSGGTGRASGRPRNQGSPCLAFPAVSEYSGEKHPESAPGSRSGKQGRL
jgi:ABC-type Zn uptake system ZnuABC Zn-binding protein ZnuA